MNRIVFPEVNFDALVSTMRADPLESFALVLARPAVIGGSRTHLLVSSVHIPAPEEYDVRTATEVTPTAAFRLPLEKKARQNNLSLIYCHSHPQQRGAPAFSPRDDAGEALLAPYAAERVPGVLHAALVVGAEGVAARALGGGDPFAVWSVGRHVTNHTLFGDAPMLDEHERQIRAFGAAGQKAIQGLRVAIVGAGGTGSVVVQQLAHLGIKRYLLIDPDVLTITNLNRVVGARRSDLGRPKMVIAERVIRRLVPDADVQCLQADVLDRGMGRRLTDADFIFCCTDSQGSRHLINQLAHQYFVPAIDMGVVIAVNDGRVTHFGGRVQMLAPGLACLVCNDGILDPNRVREDLSSPLQRQADPYFTAAVGEAQPAVISLNSSVASAAVTMFLAAVAGIPSRTRSLTLRGIQGDVRVLDDTPYAGCVVCSPEAYSGTGDVYPLPHRAES